MHYESPEHLQDYSLLQGGTENTYFTLAIVNVLVKGTLVGEAHGWRGGQRTELVNSHESEGVVPPARYNQTKVTLTQEITTESLVAPFTITPSDL